jgi:hypothetical protein
MRIVLYFHSVIAEDVETQKHGVVILFAAGEEFVGNILGEYYEDFIKIIKNFPFRVAVCHQPLPDGPKFQFLNALWFLVLASKDERVRTKFHRDLSLLETQYELLTYGIPVHQIPRTHTGNIKIKNHLQWINTRIAIDQIRESLPDTTSLTCSIIGHPGKHDVLFAKGGNAGYPGNVEFQNDVDERLDRFLSSTGDSRQKVRDEIIACVEARNGRFLHLQQGGWWEELAPEEVYQKITTFMYNYEKKLSVKVPLRSTTSNTWVFLSSNKRQKVVADNGCCG